MRKILTILLVLLLTACKPATEIPNDIETPICTENQTLVDNECVDNDEPDPDEDPIVEHPGVRDVMGFASLSVTGVGSFTEVDAEYATVATPEEFISALSNMSIKVIEITNDLAMGYNEVSETVRNSSLVRSHNMPLTHPTLIESGVSRIQIERDGDNSGLLIFSQNGSKITHTSIIIKRSQNIIIRNLEFDELWEWDEATKGEYDRNDWDYITILESDGVWIDHCTFGKAYDGLIDMKEGSKNVSISWSVFKGSADGSDPFVQDQFDYLENDKENFEMYNNFRSQGMSKEDMVKISGGQKKGHLVGSSEFAEGNENLSITLAFNHYIDVMDRLPRLREGNAHVYSIYVDSEDAFNARNLLSEKYSSIDFNGYKLGVTSQAFVSTEGGALYVQDSVLVGVNTPIKNNQKSSLAVEYTGKFRIMNIRFIKGEKNILTSSNEEGTPFIGNTMPINFSWNGFDQLPYNFTSVEPDSVVNLVTSETEGAGAGVMSWTVEDWLSITYQTQD